MAPQPAQISTTCPRIGDSPDEEAVWRGADPRGCGPAASGSATAPEASAAGRCRSYHDVCRWLNGAGADGAGAAQESGRAVERKRGELVAWGETRCRAWWNVTPGRGVGGDTLSCVVERRCRETRPVCGAERSTLPWRGGRHADVRQAQSASVVAWGETRCRAWWNVGVGGDTLSCVVERRCRETRPFCGAERNALPWRGEKHAAVAWGKTRCRGVAE